MPYEGIWCFVGYFMTHCFKKVRYKLFEEAGKTGLLVSVDGTKFKLEDIYGEKLYNSLDGFIKTEDGHLYDGIIEAYVIYSDGTILGVYASPMNNVPEEYNTCKGKLYGVIYKIGEDASVISVAYGFFPAEALELPP